MATTTVLQPRSVTAPQPFFTMGDAGDLFEVRAGVPLKDALAQASCFLDLADDVIRSIGMGTHEDDRRGVEQHAFAAKHLIEMSKAIVDSVVSTLFEQARQSAALKAA